MIPSSFISQKFIKSSYSTIYLLNIIDCEHCYSSAYLDPQIWPVISIRTSTMLFCLCWLLLLELSLWDPEQGVLAPITGVSLAFNPSFFVKAAIPVWQLTYLYHSIIHRYTNLKINTGHKMQLWSLFTIHWFLVHKPPTSFYLNQMWRVQ